MCKEKFFLFKKRSSYEMMQTKYSSLYRAGGVIFFIDYCTAIRDT